MTTKNVTQNRLKLKPSQRSRQLGQERSALPGQQLHLWEKKPEVAPYLQIQSIPVAERIDPKENRYILIILPYNVRLVGGQYSSSEAYQIAKAVRGWDWSLDPEGRPYCLPQLERLLDHICKCSGLKGGEA
jgi:hypothetical protein